MPALSSALIEVHLAWAQQDQAPMRACVLCQHSLDCARRCGHPSAIDMPAPVTTEQARAADGICGPNAALMSSVWL